MIGERIRRARESLNWTQEMLAESAAIHLLQISRYENGVTLPRLDLLVKLAQALRVSTDWLLELTDDPTPAHLPGGLSADERLALDAWRQGALLAAVRIILSVRDA